MGKYTKPPAGSTINYGHQLALGLRAVFPLNEGAGFAAELVRGLSASSHSIPWGSGIYGPALSCDGSNLSVISKVQPSNKDYWSVHAFGYNGSTSGFRNIFDADHFSQSPRWFQMRMNASTAEGIFFNTVFSDFTASGGSFGVGEISMMMTAGAGLGRLYVNGLFVDDVAITGTIGNGSGLHDIPDSVTIGRFAGVAATQPWVGLIHGAYIWERVLSTDEVAWLDDEPFAFLKLDPHISYFFLSEDLMGAVSM